MLSPQDRAAEMSLACWSHAKEEKYFPCSAVQQNWQGRVREGQRWMIISQDLKPTWSSWITPQGSSRKAVSAYSSWFGSVLHLFTSKAAFYFKAKLQELEVVISNSSALLLPGLISLLIFILLSLCQPQKEQTYCHFLISSHVYTGIQTHTPFQKQQKAAWILVTEIAMNLKWQKLPFCLDTVRVAWQSPNTLWGSAFIPSLRWPISD